MATYECNATVCDARRNIQVRELLASRVDALKVAREPSDARK